MHSKTIIERRSRGSDFPILKVVQKYLNTISRGSGHWALCPFHKDTSPSLSISETKNIFKCFACNVSGNAVTFVMQMEKCGYAEAIRKIGEILDLDISQYLNRSQNKLYELCKLNEFISIHYHKYLFNATDDSKAALNYLTSNRKLTLDTINKYRIGFAPKENTLIPIIKLYNEQQVSEVDPEIIRESNLFIQSTSKVDKIPFFRDRIMFPIVNEEGDVIAFSGRGDNPKYLHLKNNRLFTKAQSLYNIQNLEEGKPIYLFEGFMDLIRSWQELGCENGVACMGGAPNKLTFPIIRKYTNIVILCLDNDDPGRSFTIQTGKLLLSYGFEVFVVDFLDRKEKDVDEMIDAAPEVIKERMNDVIPFLEWMHKLRNPKNLSDTKQLIDECLDIFLTKNYSLKSHIQLKYALYLIDLAFGWYRLHEDKWSDIEEIVNEKRDECKKQAEKSLIRGGAPRKLSEESEGIDDFFTLDPFKQIIIKFYGILGFMQNEPVIQGNMDEWKYFLNSKFYRNDDLWFLKALDNPEDPFEADSFIVKYRSRIQMIKGDLEFFEKYYSFYREYLEAWGENEFGNYFDSLSKRLEEKWSAMKEIDELKKKSSEFFAQLKQTHPSFVADS